MDEVGVAQLRAMGPLGAQDFKVGYAASAIRERIYCAPSSDDTPMAAILIMTGTSGAEGTLGGLVEQGRFLDRHLRRAWDMATLCSSDPVCAHHSPKDAKARALMVAQ